MTNSIHTTSVAIATERNSQIPSGDRAWSIEKKIHSAILSHQQEKFDEAILYCNSIIEQEPENFEALHLLAIIAQQKEEYERAIHLFNIILRIQPNHLASLLNRGNAQRRLNLHEAALESYDQAIRAKPDFFEAIYNRGNTLFSLNRVEEAIENYKLASTINKNNANAIYNLAHCLSCLNRHTESIQAFEKVLEINKDHAEAWSCLAQCHLSLGQFQRGWELYEWRWKVDKNKSIKPCFAPSSRPWTGKEHLAGKSIIIYAEQGFGDTLQFCRYIPILAEKGGRVLIIAPKPLHGVLKTLKGVNRILNDGEKIPETEFYCAMLSLPLCCGTELETIPCSIPYITADKKLAQAWSKRIGLRKKKRVGIAFSGSTLHANDGNRSINTNQILDLLNTDADFISIQNEIPQHQLVNLTGVENFSFFGEHLSNFAETAALIENLDIIVTVDTSVAHLAGALGKPTWILLPYNSDWRWLCGRNDSPWYPCAKLFRQTRFGEWGDILQYLKTQLIAFIQSHHVPINGGMCIDSEMQKDNLIEAKTAASLELHDADDINLAVENYNLGNFETAKAKCLAILKKSPREISILRLIAAVYMQQGYFKDVLDAIEAALEIDPQHPESLLIRGNAQRHLGQHEKALESFNLAILFRPDFFEALFNRGNTLLNLGRTKDSLESYNAALRIKPNNVDVLNNRGQALVALREFKDALATYDRALTICPDSPHINLNRANVLAHLYQYDEAITAYDHAYKIDTKNITAIMNRGAVFSDMLRHEDAIREYQRVLEIKPDSADARFNLAFVYLRLGELARGWDLYEWRWKSSYFKDKKPALASVKPQWTGVEPINGKTIFIYHEQGFGDSIQFCRYIPLLVERRAKVYFQAPIQLHTLLSTLGAGFELQTGHEKLALADFQCALMSLPLAFNTTLATIPTFQSYLSADPHIQSKWNNRLGNKTRMRIGVAWSGNNTHVNDSSRSIPLDLFSDLFRVDAEFICLHKSISENEIDKLHSYSSENIRHFELSDYADTAALISMIDLVLSVDTSVAHLSAAMGKKTWVLLPVNADWRWLTNISECPWYPSIKLYRQKEINNWATVIGSVRVDIEKMANETHQNGEIQKLIIDTQDKISRRKEPVGTYMENHPVQRDIHEKSEVDDQNPLPGERVSGKDIPDSSNGHHSNTIEVAFRLHKEGMLEQAESIYTAILSLEPENFAAICLQAMLTLQSNRATEAVELFDRALALNPVHAYACFNRGNALLQLGRKTEAVASFGQAISANPAYFEAYYNRASVLAELNMHEDALQDYQQALKIDPAHAMTLYNRGNILRDMNRLPEALESYNLALTQDPHYADAYNNRGNILCSMGRYTDALECFESAIKYKTNFIDAIYNSGTTLYTLKRHTDAMSKFNAALALNPMHIGALIGRGQLLLEQHKYQAALENYDIALSYYPDSPETHLNRGNAQSKLQDNLAALESYDRSLSLKSDYFEAINNKAIVLTGLRRYKQALACCEIANKIKPDDPEILLIRAGIHIELRQYDEAEKYYANALKIKPSLEFIDGALLFSKRKLCNWSDTESQLDVLLSKISRGENASAPAFLCSLTDSGQIQKRTAQNWVRLKYPRIESLPSIEKRSRDKIIRIGYFSPDFRKHPLCYLLAEMFEMHDKSRFETTAFAFGPASDDEMRQRLIGAFDHFIDVSHQSDKDIAELARRQKIDIAIDLTGFTQNNRIGIFSIGAAPIQVSYMGYPGTMGADYIDYIIGDPILIPESHRIHYTEKIAYMPNCYMANDSKRRISDKLFTREELGLPAQGFVFCCFNNNYKITPEIYDRWMRILNKVDHSVLWLFKDNDHVVSNLKREAATRGVDPNRIIFADRMNLPEHLARHRLADLFLDTFPCNAHTTASDALWAELPVLTMPGEAFASRVAASLLNAIHLPELIADSLDTYECMAIELAKQPEKLTAIRTRLKNNRLTTSLFNCQQFTSDLECLYYMMYDRYHGGLMPDHLQLIADQPATVPSKSSGNAQQDDIRDSQNNIAMSTGR